MSIWKSQTWPRLHARHRGPRQATRRGARPAASIAALSAIFVHPIYKSACALFESPLFSHFHSLGFLLHSPPAAHGAQLTCRSPHSKTAACRRTINRLLATLADIQARRRRAAAARWFAPEAHKLAIALALAGSRPALATLMLVVARFLDDRRPERRGSRRLWRRRNWRDTRRARWRLQLAIVDRRRAADSPSERRRKRRQRIGHCSKVRRLKHTTVESSAAVAHRRRLLSLKPAHDPPYKKT